MNTLQGKIIFITGASAGIGEACAKSMAAQGARLLLAARRHDRLVQACTTLKELGAEAVHLLELDVRNPQKVAAAVASLPEEWQAIDVLINNAGLSRGLDKIQEAKIDDWEEMIDTNVKGLLYMTQAVIPGMLQRGQGHIVNLGSTAGELPYPGGSVYCGTKAAVRSINDGIRQDLLGTPIRVTSIDPGLVETEFSEVRFRGDTERAAKVYQGFTPLTADDVAEAILWAITRPTHVNIARVVLTSVHQANSLLVHRSHNS